MKKLISILLATFMLLTLVGCGGEKEETLNSKIKLGASGPLTGAAAEYGQAVKYGMEIAIEEINSLGGDIQFELNFQDDKHDAEEAVKCFNVLMDWGQQISCGTVTSAPGIAVASALTENNLFSITPSASNPSVTLKGDGTDENSYYGSIFQVCFTDNNQGKVSADYLAAHNLGNNIAVIYEDDIDYSTSIRSTFVAEAKVKGLNVVYEGTFQSNTTDFNTILTQAQNAGADVVFLPIYYSHATLILQQAKNMGYAPTFFGVDGMDGILSQDGFDASLAEGVYLLTPFSATANDEKVQNFVTKYKEKTGVTPNQFAADAYDAIYIIYECCKAGGVKASMKTSEITEILVEQILKLQYQGVTGGSSWQKNGQVNKEPMAVIIKDGAYVDAE